MEFMNKIESVSREIRFASVRGGGRKAVGGLSGDGDNKVKRMKIRRKRWSGGRGKRKEG